MYPLTCWAGFPMPVKSGKFEIAHICATVDDPTDDSRLVLQDSSTGITTDTPNDKPLKICDIKGIANANTNLEMVYGEPLKVRNGVTVISAQNLVAGSIMVFVR